MKRFRFIVVVILLLLPLAIWRAGLADETRTIQQVRSELHGLSLVSLADGTTRYQLEGPESGPLLLLIHGGREPAWTWNEVLPALHAAGLRTLRYDMYGRGYSDRPTQAPYTQAMYLAQLEQLVEALEIDQPLHVIGYSFGATVAVAFANTHSHQVLSVGVLAPRYYALDVPMAARIPVLNRALVKHVVKPRALQAVQKYFSTPVLKRKYDQRVGEPYGVVGNQQAFLRFILADALSATESLYRDFQRTNIPLTIFSGGKDSDISAQHIREIQTLVPAAQHHHFEDADHGLVWQQGDKIGLIIAATAMRTNVDRVERVQPEGVNMAHAPGALFD